MLVKNMFTAMVRHEVKLVSSCPITAENEWNPGWFAIFLALLVMVTFPGVLLGNQTFVFRDFGLFSYPVAFFQRQSFWSGEVPLWNPLSYSGLPFLAQWNTMTLYPPSLVYMFFPLSWSLPFFCMAHLFWGGLGMYFLARSLTRNPLAAVLAGTAFSFGGLMLSLITWQSHVATYSWVPWIIWLGQHGWREGGKALVWATGAGTMQMLAGAPETIVLTWGILFLLACGDAIKKEATPLRIASRFLVVVTLVTFISAPQLLPFLQLLEHSQRDSGFGTTGWSMPLWGWANLLVPLFRTSPTPQGVYLQDGQYAFSTYYGGIGVLVLGLIAIRYAQDWRTRLVAALALIGLVLALGDNGWIYRVLRTCVPVLGFSRYPIKFVILAAALFPLMAAFGFDALARRRTRLDGFEWGCAVAILMLIGVILCLEPKASQATWHASLQNGLERALILVLTLIILDLYLRSKAQVRLLLGALLAIAFWLDLAQLPSVNPVVSPAVYSPGWVEGGRNWKTRPTLGDGRAMVAPGPEKALNLHSMKSLEDTYLVQRLGLFSDCNLIDQVPKVHGFFSLVPAEINLITYGLYEQTNLDFAPLLDFMGISETLTSAESLDWIERPSAMPLVTVGQQPLFVEDQAALSAFVQTNMDFRKLVFLPKDARTAVSAGSQPLAKVTAAKFSNQIVSFQVSSPSTTMAVVSQTFYPCWTAYVDGKPVHLWRANYSFQALEVPPGQHEIEIKYRDKAFLAGLGFSGLGSLLCITVWAIAHLKQRMKS